MHRRPVPLRAFEALGYEVAHSASPVERRRDRIAGRLDDVEVGFPGSPRGASRRGRARPGRSAPRAAAFGCGACTCPTAARWTTRTTATSWLAGRAAGRRARVARRRPRGADRADAATGTSPRTTTTSGTSSSSAAAPTSAPAERAAFRRSSTPGSPTSSGPTPPARRYTYWDYTQLRFPRRGHAHRLRRSPPRRWPPGSPGPDRPRGAQGQGRSDHAPVLVELAGP